MSEAGAAAPPACTVERVQGSAFAALAALHAELMPGRDLSLSARYLAWKYAENPYIAQPRLYLAHQDGKLVGMRGFFGAAWEAGGHSEIVPCAADLVVAPDYRNQGVASRIMETAAADLSADGFSHIFSLSAGRVTALGQLTQGFKAVAPMDPLMLSRRSMLERLMGAQTQFAVFDRVEEQSGFAASAAPQPEAMAALIASLPAGGLRQRRDAAYLAWRYANPIGDYRFLYAGGDRLEGYIALGAKRNDPASPVWILDWEAKSERLRAALLAAAIARGRFRQLGAWRFGIAAGGAQILADAGFAPEQGPAALSSLRIAAMIKPLGPGMALCGADVRSPAAWDFRMLYSDFC